MALKGIYLGAYRALHPGHNIVYQDINGLRDIGGDMLQVDLAPYDYIIATPPCNWWSKARGSKRPSLYAENTKHLLPAILDKLLLLGKPFIVENVRNYPKFLKAGLLHKGCFIYYIGRHTYWTNILLPCDVEQTGTEYLKYISSCNRQGGVNVHNVVEMFLYSICA